MLEASAVKELIGAVALLSGWLFSPNAPKMPLVGRDPRPLGCAPVHGVARVNRHEYMYICPYVVVCAMVAASLP